MILWIIFSESGPAGPGTAEALIVPLPNFCFSLLCFNREQDQFARNPLPMISLELVI